MYARVKNLSRMIRGILNTVDFKKHEIDVVVANTVSMGNNANYGDDSYTMVVDIARRKYRVYRGAKGKGSHGIGLDQLVIKGRKGACAWATIYVNPESNHDFIPKAESVSKGERNVLVIYHSLKSGKQRQDALRYAANSDLNEDLLVEKRLLARTANGIRITTEGKNALCE